MTALNITTPSDRESISALDRLARGLVRLTITITHVEADESAG